MKPQLFYRKFRVRMKNGDVFTSTIQTLEQAKLLKFVEMFEKIQDLTYFSFDGIYMNGKDISSIQIIKPWWNRS